MKLKVLTVIILSLLVLTGCQNKPSTHEQQIKTEQRNKTIKANQKNWNKKLENIKVLDQNEFENAFIKIPNGYNDESTSLKNLENGNQYLIEGQLIDLKSMIDRPIAPETEAIVYVSKVISGDRKLQGKTIKTVFAGGLTKGKYLYEDYGIKNSQETIYYSSATFPMPKIGSHLIMGIGNYHPDNKRQEEMYGKFGLTKNNFYTINNPETTFWVKTNGKYQINNPAFNNSAAKHEFKNIYKLTDKFNQQ
ncbi:hypothetical protein [Companilactobacillus bobalius]|uniref:Lipoprotein n=1 Tax=Companilactobacillus bobalius TaxID=2801451 RepID=A0A202FD51_9LACO|nr:hypothetical protein [Companilactobacillus bobalius]KAE9561747.1 hypothetical protein ATN92_06635 [Companilactobacillus bobalius]OVE98368.1 hypothetical protein LKACC16343_01255 [Companilactobacillus bobalius]GEO57590.1 hypothetical protein LBO01_07190 [Companilactobacillus paralimentarius]